MKSMKRPSVIIAIAILLVLAGVCLISVRKESSGQLASSALERLNGSWGKTYHCLRSVTIENAHASSQSDHANLVFSLNGRRIRLPAPAEEIRVYLNYGAITLPEDASACLVIETLDHTGKAATERIRVRARTPPPSDASTQPAESAPQGDYPPGFHPVPATTRSDSDGIVLHLPDTGEDRVLRAVSALTISQAGQPQPHYVQATIVGRGYSVVMRCDRYPEDEYLLSRGASDHIAAVSAILTESGVAETQATQLAAAAYDTIMHLPGPERLRRLLLTSPEQVKASATPAEVAEAVLLAVARTITESKWTRCQRFETREHAVYVLSSANAASPWRSGRNIVLVYATNGQFRFQLDLHVQDGVLLSKSPLEMASDLVEP